MRSNFKRKICMLVVMVFLISGTCPVFAVESDQINGSNVTVTNNYNTPTTVKDTIAVTGLATGDVVKAYQGASGGTAIGTSPAVSSGTATVSLILPALTTPTTVGSIYLSLTSTGKTEGTTRTAISYYSADEESTAPTSSNVTVTNNYGLTKDKIIIVGLTPGDIAKAYDASSAGILKGTSLAVAASTTTASIDLILPSSTTSGTIYVSVTSKNKKESSRTSVSYSAEPQNTAPSSSDVTVTNNYGTLLKDTILVKNISATDVVKAYAASTGGIALGTATAAAGTTSATISLTLPSSSTDGSIYVSVKSTKKTESDRTKIDYIAEQTTTSPSAGDITVKNNYVGTSDTVAVTGLSPKDIVKVYKDDTATTALGTGTVLATSTSVSISIAQVAAVPTTSGSIYVSVTSIGKKESGRTKVDYDVEPTTTSVSASNISVTNLYLLKDTVTVKGVLPTDTIKVYATSSSSVALGTVLVPAGTTSASVSLTLPSTSSGSIFVTVKSKNKQESAREEVTYLAEADSTTPPSILVINEVGINDFILVYGLKTGDTVKVYNAASAGTVLATGKVLDKQTRLTLTTTANLGASGGTIYVTRTSPGYKESARVAVTVLAE